MGVYNKLLTTKTIRVKMENGRETLNIDRYMGKYSSWGKPRAWEQALMSRMDDIFAARGYPKYVTGDGADEGWPVYERVEIASYTDEYPSSRILAGFLRRGEGKMLHFEKWSRLMVDVTKGYKHSIQTEISETLRESGVVGTFQTSTFNDIIDGLGETFVVIYTPEDAGVIRAKLVLAGDSTIHN